MKIVSLVWRLGRPGHEKANAFLKASFDEALKKSKSLDDCHEIVAAMVSVSHPDATDAFVAAFEKHNKKVDYHVYWFARMIPDLPKAALSRLESLLPGVTERVADQLIGYLQQLRDKK